MNRKHCQFDRLAIVGVGLIGGSVALAARQRGICREVLGIGRNAERLAMACVQGVLDVAETGISACRSADLVILATPVDRIADDALAVLASTGPETLVTDAGSIKGEIIRAVRQSDQRDRFLGSHPLAGSHQSGFEHAQADLFEKRLCVLTPDHFTPKHQVERLQSFWSALGMNVRVMDADQHDRTLALTSHLPHLVAAALASQVDESSLEYAATGFRDTTRIAAGDPNLWTAIFSLNAEQLVPVTESLIETLSQMRDAMARQDRSAVQALLQRACERRRQFREAGDPLANDSQTAEGTPWT